MEDSSIDDGEKQSTSIEKGSALLQETTAAIEKTKELLITAKATIVHSNKELTEFLNQQTHDFGHYEQFGYTPYCTPRRSKRRFPKSNTPIPTHLPVMTKNDIVVFMDEDRVTLGSISVNTQMQPSMRYNTGRGLIPGHQVNVFTIPDDDQDFFDVCKLVVIDRGFYLGEKVGWAHQTFMKQPREHYFPWQQEHKGLHGIVVDYKVSGDVLLLPDKKHVIRNVDLLKFEPLVMAPCREKREGNMFGMGFTSNKLRQITIVSYEGWIGEVLNQTNKVSLEYDKNFIITFVDDGKVVKLMPADGSYENKNFIPGQLVNVRLRDLLDPICTWNQQAPQELFTQTRGIKGRKSSVQCTILAVKPESMNITWRRAIDTKALSEPPSQIQGEECQKIQVIHRTRLVRAGDRLSIKREHLNGIQICERSDFETVLDKTFNEIVKKKEAEKLAVCLPDPNDFEDYPFSKDLMNHIRIIPRRKMKFYQQSDIQASPSKTPDPVFEPLEDLPPLETTKIDDEKLLNDEVIVEVLITQTKVSIMWSDGTISDDVDGRLLAPIPDKGMAAGTNAAGIPMLFPGNVVQRKNYPLKGPVVGILSGPNTSLDINKFQNNDDNYGIVLSVNDEERFAKVQWLKVIHGKVIQVEEIEDCPLFELSYPMEVFKISPGRLGILSEAEISSRRDGLLDSLFIAGRHLPNGQRVVRFLNGNDGYLWPVEMRSVSDFQFRYGGLVALGKTGIPSILKKDPLNLLSDHLKLTQNTEQPTKKEEESTQTSDVGGEWAMESSSNGIADSEKAPEKKDKIEALESEPFVGIVNQDFTMSINDDDILSTSDSIDDYKLPITFVAPSSNLTSDDYAETLATIAAAAQMAYPKSSLANEIKRQCDLVKSKTGSMVFDVMSELVKLVEKDLLKPAEIDLGSFVAKVTASEAETIHSEVITCIQTLLTLPHCDQMLQSLKLALDLKTNSGNPKTVANVANMKNGNASIQNFAITTEPSASKKLFKEPGEEESAEKLSTFSSDSSFQMLPSCTAHKWLKVESASFNAAFKRAIQKEYKMFAELPEGIYVRAYEDRLDLLHAIIVGPRGTPFDSTPYFFEIKLPEEYPNKPPKVNFVPYSTEALNPNLYQEGKVCLSLLGTWAGRKSEKWDPNISNLQQVFLSIQGLILNAEPYWNEPGREHSKKDPQQIIASQRYNEATTMSSIQYMERIFETPPPSFEGMIRQIIRVRLPDYRSRIESWFDENDSSSKPEYPLPRLSKGFQLALSNALNRIQRAIDESSRNNFSEANGDEPMAL